MDDTPWQSYERGDFRASLRLALEGLIRNGGIDDLHVAGLSLLQRRQIADGMMVLKAAATFRPNMIELYWNAAQAAQTLCLPDEVEYFTQRGLRDFPDDAVLQALADNIPLLRMDFAGAVVTYQHALQRDPRNIRALINLGNAYRNLSDFEHAEEAFQRAAELDANNTDLRLGRSVLYGQWGHPDAAMALLDGLDDVDARYALALYTLGAGDYERGWVLHQDRWRSVGFNRATPPPRPFQAVSQIVGERVAVMREGGFGDLFQFLRYLPMLAEHAYEVMLPVLAGEAALFRPNLPANVVLQECASLDQIAIDNRWEWTVALFDLPLVFGTTLTTIPADLPYLKPPAVAEVLPATTRKRVGLVWAGGGTTGINERAYDSRRSIRLSELADLGRVEGIELISLQHGERANDDGLSLTRVLEPGADWFRTASIIAQLDLIISVDTAVVHLAAAMGRPTWLLSRLDPCWRWLRNRPDSPWYPGVLRVFGQQRYNDWSATICEVVTALEDWASS